MSIEAVARALNVEGVTPAERLVLIGIANHDGDGGAWPSISTLARYACVTPRNVQKTIRQMEAKGWLQVQRNAGGTLQTGPHVRPNRYLIAWSKFSTGVSPTTGGRKSTGVSPTTGDPLSPTTPEPSIEPSGGKFPSQTGPRAARGRHREIRPYDVPAEEAEVIEARYGITNEDES